MQVVVGLGNPGETYAGTRHNIGFRVLDQVAESVGASGWHRRWQSDVAQVGGTWFLKPQTWMNRSGDALLEVMDACEIEPGAVLVVTDDVALPLGRLRIRGEGSAGGHNGLASIETALASRAYPRVRVGVGGAEPVTGAALVPFVLGAFTEAERAQLTVVIPRAAAAVWSWCREGLEATQNRYNGWCPGVLPTGTESPNAGEDAGRGGEVEAEPGADLRGM